ncbi:putative Holo-(acyl-carrier-protein) synthase [Hyella patelloides LEGE 07179]|uniref:Putative Holo-(Acyl-carrier-protein) synthase n=1 Tax=Hyella patelloides LEGE 07179 TaxID=945734 RepID=A0A563VWE1_9CYAN|nr:hypothetical protein [Hyella patelloides]VEP15736.1 putative Holo-(acyl-carrier-protein) synthase [Hyella patelloides LEGE 07179]
MRTCSVAYQAGSVQFIAGRIAAKKAVLQALGQEDKSISWLELEIQRLPTGQPFVVLYGNNLKVATELCIDKWLLSISHTSDYATASAIALCCEEPNLKY